MIHSINMKDFRLFKNISINLGKYLTVISGKNALGKTTILALLGNSCQLDIEEGRPILQKQFSTEFKEIFNGSVKHDLAGSNKCCINFSNIDNPDDVIESRICRTTWQIANKVKNGKIIKKYKRFRVIPEKFEDKKKINSQKYKWPVLYLGLSRLFPIGEVEPLDLTIKNLRLTDEEKKYFIQNYNKIFNIISENEIAIDSVNINGNNRKNGVGISTNEYESITNSAGQDNLGQIILSVMSFKRLKKENPNYKGGVLLIDELDAVLHPIAQVELLNYLLRSCKDLDIQVVTTTHSITILEEVSKMVAKNKSNRVNDVQLVYLTKDNGALEVLENPIYQRLYYDLNLSSLRENPMKLTVYSEDPEARWFIKKLLCKYIYRLELVEVKLGCTELLKLNKADPKYFSKILFILDGDVDQNILDKYATPINNNVLKLPGKLSIEEEIYNYLENLQIDDPLSRSLSVEGFTKRYLQSNRPKNDYKSKKREKYKQWFNDLLPYFEALNIFEHWQKDNKEICDEFIGNFIGAFNQIAQRTLLPKIIK